MHNISPELFFQNLIFSAEPFVEGVLHFRHLWILLKKIFSLMIEVDTFFSQSY